MLPSNEAVARTKIVEIASKCHLYFVVAVDDTNGQQQLIALKNKSKWKPDVYFYAQSMFNAQASIRKDAEAFKIDLPKPFMWRDVLHLVRICMPSTRCIADGSLHVAQFK